MIDRRQLVQYITIATLIVAGIICFAIARDISSHSAATSKETIRAYDKPEDDSSPLVIDGLKSTDLPGAIRTTVLDQIYARHYEQAGLVERKATLVSPMKKLSDTYQFSLKFLPSDKAYRVTIKIKNDVTNYYDFVMEKL